MGGGHIDFKVKMEERKLQEWRKITLLTTRQSNSLGWEDRRTLLGKAGDCELNSESCN